MCGIVGIFNHGTNLQVDAEELERINDYMIPRGPDGSGVWFSDDRRIGHAHRRLAIIDLSDTGAQPMISGDGNYVISYNGEIFNFKTLRSSLEAQGHLFHSTSDTEVLLKLYETRGHRMVDDLRGMYAFMIWDKKEKKLFCARDPFGIKPLYYADDGKTFRAASQVKALLSGCGIDTSPEPAGHVGFFLWGHLPEPYTLYKEIRELPAGSTLTVDMEGRSRIETFCDIASEIAQASRSRSDLPRHEMQEALRGSLSDSVCHHLVADVPVGVFLSAGLDSTTMAALTHEHQSHFHTVTLGFNEFRGTDRDEVPLAEEVARLYDTRHQTLWVNGTDFRQELETLLKAMDQPTIDGVNSYFVSKVTAQAGLKVAVSGLGGDEMFGGYGSFMKVPQMARLIRPLAAVPGLGRLFRVVSAPLIRRMTSPKYAGLIELGGNHGGAYLLRRGLFTPWELPEILDADMVREGWKELDVLGNLEVTTSRIEGDFHKVSALEMSWYMRNQLLRDTDWASMAHSLEVRVPFVDVPLLRTVAPMMGRTGSPTKRSMAQTPSTPLPEAVLDRPKTGFLIPVREWLLAGQPETDRRFQRGIRGWARRVYDAHTA